MQYVVYKIFNGDPLKTIHAAFPFNKIEDAEKYIESDKFAIETLGDDVLAYYPSKNIRYSIKELNDEERRSLQ